MMSKGLSNDIFDSELVRHFMAPGRDGDVNICQSEDGQLYFKGYPECEFLRQVSVFHLFNLSLIQINLVLHMWNEKGLFPVKFVKVEGFTDETDICI